MKSDYKTIEWVKVNQDVDMTSMEVVSHWGGSPIDPMEAILSDLEELKLTDEVLRCESIEDLYKTLKNANYLQLDGQLEHYKKVWFVISECFKISGTVIFHRAFVNKLSKIPHQYALRSKTAELVLKLL